MSDTNNIVEAKVLDNVDDASQVQDEDNPGVEAPKHSDVNEDSPIMPSPQQEVYYPTAFNSFYVGKNFTCYRYLGNQFRALYKLYHVLQPASVQC